MSQEALFGGRKVAVQFHSPSGDRLLDDTVLVRQLPLRLLQDYFDAQLENEAKVIALLCDKKVEWTDRLTQESVEAVLKAGEELNDGPFDRWLKRKSERMGRIQAAVAGYLSQSGLPRPPSPAA